MRPGVILIMFDVPVETKEDRKLYTSLMKIIKEEGYTRIQNSLYFKQIRNIKMSTYNIKLFKKVAREGTNIKALVLTYDQFERIQVISGDKIELDKDKTLII